MILPEADRNQIRMAETEAVFLLQDTKAKGKTELFVCFSKRSENDIRLIQKAMPIVAAMHLCFILDEMPYLGLRSCSF